MRPKAETMNFRVKIGIFKAKIQIDFARNWKRDSHRLFITLLQKILTNFEFDTATVRAYVSEGGKANFFGSKNDISRRKLTSISHKIEIETFRDGS